MDHFLLDLRCFFQSCRRDRGFIVVAIATVALGVGVTIAVFSVVNAVLLRPLPYPDPSELVAFTQVTPQGSLPAASAPKFNLWSELTETVTDLSAYTFGVVNVVGVDDSEQVSSAIVSAEFFRLLGAPLIVGRGFAPGEDRPGAARVAVISRSLWQRRFGADPNVVGQAILLNGEPHLLIGVLGSFDATPLRSYTGTPEVWLSLQIDRSSTDHGNYFSALARLAPGVTLSAARARVQASAAEFRQQFPGMLRPTDTFGLVPMQEMLVGDSRTPLRVVAGAVALLLLTACGNVATLLLSRASTRGGEMAVRSALGASRGRIFRQLLTESMVLAIAGGALGFVTGIVGIDVIMVMAPSSLTWLGANGASIRPDLSVAIFALVVSMLAGVIFGLAPALAVSRSSGSEAGGLRRSSHPGQTRLRPVLVVSQTALAVMLLIGATLLMRSLIAMRTIDTGFDSGNVLTMRMSLAGPGFTTTAALDRLVQSGVERTRAVPGVVAAGASFGLPLEDDLGLRFVIDGRQLDGAFHGMAGWRMISPGYFDVFRIPVTRGRGFGEADRVGTPDVVIISETMARQFWPDSDPLQDRLIIGRGLGPAFDTSPRQIIGIAKDVRDSALDRAPRPLMYIPLAQLSDGVTALNASLQPLAWLARTQVAPYTVSTPMTEELRRMSGGLPIARVRSMDDVLARSVSGQTFNALVLAVFGGAALLLAAIGMYGLMSYTVEQQKRELAIRLALGAAPAVIHRLVARQATWLVVTGLTLGLGLAVVLARFMASLLFGVTSSDPVTFAIVSVVLSVSAALAVWYPVRRAGRVAPMMALRLG